MSARMKFGIIGPKKVESLMGSDGSLANVQFGLAACFADHGQTAIVSADSNDVPLPVAGAFRSGDITRRCVAVVWII